MILASGCDKMTSGTHSDGCYRCEQQGSDYKIFSLRAFKASIREQWGQPDCFAFFIDWQFTLGHKSRSVCNLRVSLWTRLGAVPSKDTDNKAISGTAASCGHCSRCLWSLSVINRIKSDWFEWSVVTQSFSMDYKMSNYEKHLISCIGASRENVQE